ncbi:hypothetical protein [Campylobacter geochelonis]|uniref:ApeP family dehydratase n=1 Tax=Campylobacter geochelonis TaxID=1780362 RepID=UPI0007709DAA|nr:hypothetical protein [Campylobacter geochelonis]CZE49326.1 thioester dehydrase family protein [Campylobacter geochelonis]
MKFSIDTLLPHSNDMIMIDEIVEISPEQITAKRLIKEGDVYVSDAKLAGFAMLELMAQTIGAYAGYYAKTNGAKPTLGFLIGSRKFDILKDGIEVGVCVHIKAVCSIQDESGFGVWDGEIYDQKQIYATAKLSVLSPNQETLERMKR